MHAQKFARKWVRLTRIALLLVATVLICGGIVRSAEASPSCMTHREAREKYRGDWLYWHTSKHCWDNRKTKIAPDTVEVERVPVPMPRPAAAELASAEPKSYGFLMDRWWDPNISLRPDRWINEMREFGREKR